MAEEHTNTRKITLREFKPDSYKVWEMSTKAMLKFHKLLDIVDGSEPDPTPRTNDGAIRRPISAAVQARIDKWQYDHERAREAIIRCLPDAELLKLDDVQEDVTAIWKRLHDEYGRPSNLEYVRASNELTLLKKDEKTSINDHINKFEQLVYEVNYNKPSDTRNMEESVVNLKFLNTLMVDKTSAEKWETFINAKGPQLETMSTQQLYAEVRVNAGRAKLAETLPNEVKALQTEFQQSIRALNTRMDNFHRGNANREEGKGGKEGRNSKGDSRSGRNASNKRGRGGQRNNNRKTRYPYDTNKSCEIHGRGHSTDQCIVLKRRARDAEQAEQSNRQGNHGDYRPSFNRPSHFTATVTRLIVNNTKLDKTSNPRAWIIDSGANAYITPFKERLHNYHEFEKGKVRVKGFAGKPEYARGMGSILLTDPSGNKVTLNDVVYVPESPDQILSLMKLRRELQADFAFTALETFDLTYPNGVVFTEKSVNDILYIWESPSLRINAVTTRNASKKRTLEQVDDDENFQPETLKNGPIRSTNSASSTPTNPTKIEPLQCSPNNLWHLRFGHASTTILRKLPYIRSNHDSAHCIVCIRAKQTRKPFHPAESKVTRKLERIHSDLCGPFPTSKGNSIYIITFLDELTHWCWIATIPDKTSATVYQEYRNLIKQIETESDLKIKYLRTDSGKEYQGFVSPFLKELGIKHEPTSPHSPQSNGKAERLNRTLETFTRAMLFQANMPKSF